MKMELSMKDIGRVDRRMVMVLKALKLEENKRYCLKENLLMDRGQDLIGLKLKINMKTIKITLLRYTKL